MRMELEALDPDGYQVEITTYEPAPA